MCFKIISNQLYTDHTIQLLFPHIYRVVQNPLCRTVFTEKPPCSNKITEAMIKALDEQKFEVLGKSKVHKVDFGIGLSAPACTCKDWEAYRIPCKHFFAIFNWFPEWDGKNHHKLIKIPHVCV